MPTITYNGQSFAIDGKRIWILGAAVQYARVPSELWADRIAAVKQAGFNTVATSCPWFVHEQRPGSFSFDGDADVRRFIELCDEQGLRVMLRIGPFVGSEFDAGGLPGWLVEQPGIKLREANEKFLEHISTYFRKLLSKISDLQATTGGPIILIQSEHAWTCSNETQALKYLHEMTRFVRESGIDVPMTNANDLWQESKGTIDTWRGYRNLLSHLRQLRTVQPDAPRIVSEFNPSIIPFWGMVDTSRGSKSGEAHEKSSMEVMRRLAEVLSAGAQPIVKPFHGGTNFGFMGGRLIGQPDGFATSSAAFDAPLLEAGGRGDKYNALKRIVTFANHFSPVFADFDPEFQPAVADPEDTATTLSVVPARGAQGRIIFVFADKPGATSTLVLDDGIRLPVDLGDQLVGWYALNVDLQGAGRLNYANVCPWAIIDRSVAVFFGPAKTQALLSIDNTPLEVSIPAAGSKPVVIEREGLTIVICNQSQIDSTYHDVKAVYVGVSGFDPDGSPLPAQGIPKAWKITQGATIEEVQFESTPVRARPRSTSIQLGSWEVSPQEDYITGESPRFASLNGPESLSQCGSPTGYGWYRITLNSSRKRTAYVAQSADRIHLFINGKRNRIIGVGPGAELKPFNLASSRDPITLVALADNLGRFSDGNDVHEWKGLWGHLYDVREVRSPKPKIEDDDPVDPFELRGFIAGRAEGLLSDTRQVVWRFAVRTNTPLILVINGAMSTGTIVLNDSPISYYAGQTGGCGSRFLLDPQSSAFKRGKNVLRFAPDPGQPEAPKEIVRAATLYMCSDSITAKAKWSFAKWEPPVKASYNAVTKADAARLKGTPTWWRTTFEIPEDDGSSPVLPLWFQTSGLSKGQVFINGRNLGRYFSAVATRGTRKVGPQTHLYVPEPWLRTEKVNELLIFDEHGLDPFRTKVLRKAEP